MRDHATTRDALDEPLFLELRDRLLPASPPEPSADLKVAFRDGLGEVRAFQDPVFRRPARRPIAVAGLAAALLLGAAGAAGGLPGPAQSAFDRTAGLVGLEREDAKPRPMVAPDGMEPPAPSPVEADGGAGEGSADDVVVPDVSDPATSGLDDAGQVVDEGGDLRPADPPPSAPPTAPAPVTPPVPTTVQPGPPADPPGEQIDPERPGAPGESGPPPAGGRP